MFRQIIVMLALTSGALAYGAGVYKWVDEKGAVQYRDTPPPQGTVYKALQKPSGSQYDPSATLKQLQEKVKALDTERTATQTKKGEQVAQATENCDLAKKNLDILATSANPVRIDDQGNRVPLSAADRQAAVDQQQQYLDKYCSP
jgi:hypothetical protein